MGFGARLRRLREDRGWSRHELAARLQASYSTVAKYESGLRSPDQETLTQIASILDTSADYLLGLTDNPTPPPSIDESEVIIRNYPDPPEGYEKLTPEQREELDRSTREWQQTMIRLLLDERGQNRR